MTYTVNNNNFFFSLPFSFHSPFPPLVLCVLSSLSDRMWYCFASRSATQSLCAIARRCGFRRSAAFVPTRPSCSSDARTIFASCTATRPTCPTSRIETRLCGKTNDIKAYPSDSLYSGAFSSVLCSLEVIVGSCGWITRYCITKIKFSIRERKKKIVFVMIMINDTCSMGGSQEQIKGRNVGEKI